MKIAMGNDHSAVEMKDAIKAYVESKGYEVIDFGTNSTASCDYPEFGEKVGRAVADGEVDYGIAICGTGIGIGIAAGKVKGVRVCTCSEPYSARMSRRHNNTNVLTFGARVVGVEMAKMIVDEWLDNQYEGERHARRVGMLAEIESRN
jgi:ribose 5-phosphate isomerase B